MYTRRDIPSEDCERVLNSVGVGILSSVGHSPGRHFYLTKTSGALLQRSYATGIHVVGNVLCDFSDLLSEQLACCSGLYFMCMIG